MAAGLRQPQSHDVPAQQNRAGKVRQTQQPWPLAHKILLLGKGQNKVQKQCRLQDPGNDVAPVNRPVKVVQFAGVLERIRNERNQAEDVKMRRTRGGPSA